MSEIGPKFDLILVLKTVFFVLSFIYEYLVVLRLRIYNILWFSGKLTFGLLMKMNKKVNSVRKETCRTEDLEWSAPKPFCGIKIQTSMETATIK